jgi:ubiquinone/menaquinone biosynthesis C-methylase UbiE
MFMSLRQALLNHSWGRWILGIVEKKRVEDLWRDIEQHVRVGRKVLDVGSGLGGVSKRAQEAGLEVVPLDVEDLAIHEEVRPVLYDGQVIPFGEDEFDVAMVVTVLHHTADPEQVLREVKRVAKRVVIVEEIFHSKWEKYLTFVMDSVVNLELIGHPHSNKSDKQWREVFGRLELELEYVSHRRYWGVFWSSMYVLGR